MNKIFPAGGARFRLPGAWYDRGRDFLKVQANDLLDLVYPPVCGLCGEPADSVDRLVCTGCWDMIPSMEAPFCLNCHQLLLSRLSCPYCGADALTVFAMGVYDLTFKAILHDLKFGGLKPLAAVIGYRIAALIAQQGRGLRLDGILAVPLHPAHEYYRGFNQAAEIARAIANGLNLPFFEDALVTTRRTRQQSRLSARQREDNVRGAYAVADDAPVFRGKSLLIVDDITTTGATLKENVRVLREAGAGRITAAVAAVAV